MIFAFNGKVPLTCTACAHFNRTDQNRRQGQWEGALLPDTDADCFDLGGPCPQLAMKSIIGCTTVYRLGVVGLLFYR